jgi:hypothetical protein
MSDKVQPIPTGADPAGGAGGADGNNLDMKDVT